jgi:putative oxidoreductase
MPPGRSIQAPALARVASHQLTLQEITMNEQRLQSLGAALLRVALGVMFLVHSLYLKLVVFTLPGTVKFYESLGLPGWGAHATILAEAAGGTLLVLGLRTREASAVLLPVLLGATWVHWKNGWLFTNAGGGWEYPVFLAAATVTQILLGNGAYALSGRSAAAPTPVILRRHAA